MIVWLRHFLSWAVSAFRSREDLILETSHSVNNYSISTPNDLADGAIFGLAYTRAGGTYGRIVVITGNTGGAAWTPDEGTTWFPLSGVNGYWGIGFAGPKAGWLVGVNGTILKVSF